MSQHPFSNLLSEEEKTHSFHLEKSTTKNNWGDIFGIVSLFFAILAFGPLYYSFGREGSVVRLFMVFYSFVVLVCSVISSLKANCKGKCIVSIAISGTIFLTLLTYSLVLGF